LNISEGFDLMFSGPRLIKYFSHYLNLLLKRRIVKGFFK
jgi:hypothetical protein